MHLLIRGLLKLHTQNITYSSLTKYSLLNYQGSYLFNTQETTTANAFTSWNS